MALKAAKRNLNQPESLRARWRDHRDRNGEGRNPERASDRNAGSQACFSEADIARTGDARYRGRPVARERIEPWSETVGCFVRGLGDRYSLALLNVPSLPSPEPLSRVVPLDIFPTNVIASSLVQKTYSANYPGEFGGGVINLTTRAVPTEDFLKRSRSAAEYDSETNVRKRIDLFRLALGRARFSIMAIVTSPRFCNSISTVDVPLDQIPLDATVGDPNALTREGNCRPDHAAQSGHPAARRQPAGQLFPPT